jgi:ribosomal protein S14
MCNCANCGASKTALYDDRADLYFCGEQCFREWADDKGAEIVREFYRSMNVSEVDT